MKQVMKAESPEAFENWKNLSHENWQPTYENLQNPEKRTLHVSLLVEQGWVCCYCGRSVSMDDSHIEHFRPQERYDHLALDYENLHASCIRETNHDTPIHCGHAKGSDFDEAQHISPLDPECETRFVYAESGVIAASDASDASAGFMIGLLRLNSPFLCNRRSEVIRRAFDPDFLATATQDELRRFSASLRGSDKQGAKQTFGHVLARFAEQRLPDIESSNDQVPGRGT